MMEHKEPTTVSSLKAKLFLIITLITTISLIIIIAIVLLTSSNYQQQQSPSESAVIKSLKTFSEQSTTTSTTTISPEEIQRLSLFREFLNLSSNRPNPNLSRSSLTMNKFMRSIYRQTYDEIGVQRKKRYLNQHSNLYLSEDLDSIISLPNQYQHSSTNISYHFEYDGALDYLTYAEFILPMHHVSMIQIFFSTFNISFNRAFTKDKNWLKLNLTQYTTSFPLKFHVQFIHTKQKSASFSSGFLTLYFRRPSHAISRRDLSSFYDNQLITYPDDPSYCQVRPLRTSFSELNWSSWIIEPSSYEMNVCSGTCQTQSNMGTYFIVQNLLNQKYPNRIPAPCCRPKRFSSTIILYYDGPNLVLKRHENMRVVECGCSS
ncbi:unnamed protein product [Rotaria magnacalcarata]|uniref:TGF-beta family profile domain-containing protein n=2 Tax=Rotaria magnacalcarata TaxID=392030 RepID=A0A818WKN0_9BILA|nr:unnamed protein product [Rotaria magnacalcarata]CAF3726291.1 unnamed protein product [Rotaria magnacalcarata]CAF4061605.1 unnamed protein product [Rotaria magnacalcarata]